MGNFKFCTYSRDNIIKDKFLQNHSFRPTNLFQSINIKIPCKLQPSSPWPSLLTNLVGDKIVDVFEDFKMLVAS